MMRILLKCTRRINIGVCFYADEVIMTQDEKWLLKYQEVRTFIEENHRNPSKHRIEEHDMLNWVKANRKALNAGKMKAERVKLFEEQQALMEEYKRVNQHLLYTKLNNISRC